MIVCLNGPCYWDQRGACGQMANEDF